MRDLKERKGDWRQTVMTDVQFLWPLRHRGGPERRYWHPLLALARHGAKELPGDSWQQQDGW
jgi:hypothetical protein